MATLYCVGRAAGLPTVPAARTLWIATRHTCPSWAAQISSDLTGRARWITSQADGNFALARPRREVSGVHSRWDALTVGWGRGCARHVAANDAQPLLPA